jgi:type III restriction enzyme
MILSLKNYQRIAVDRLKNFFGFYIEEESNLVVFKAPTGSGKTLMASIMMEELVNENENVDFCFVWASIGWADLHFQSFLNVKDYLNDSPKCSLLDSEFFGSRHYINKHEIVFVNWEKLVSKDSKTGEWKNTLMQDQEGSSFLNVINETKNRGTKIVLIVDEAHRGTQAVATRIQEFRETIIDPTFTIEMSATPTNRPNVNVRVEDVIEEGMIKKDIIVNEGITTDFTDDELTSEQVVLEKGYQKRLELIKEYEKIDSKVKPLVLIQIPNSEQGDAKIDIILDFFREKGITLENKKLKIWTSEYKLTAEEKRDMKSSDNPTEFLVFKTAVATGWDCPRAHILVKFREGNSESFEIQTIGRILRTAEAKSYDINLLDNAYIFTNLSNFVTTQDSYSPNRVKTEVSYFRTLNGQSVYSPINLVSFYRSREGDYNSADTEFYEYYERSFREYFGITDDDIFQNQIIDKLVSKGVHFGDEVILGVMTQTGIEVVKIDESQNIGSESTYLKMSDNDIEFAYYNVIKDNLSGLAYIRSKSSINGAITESFFNNKVITEKARKISGTQKLFLKNKDIFSSILSKATKEFRDYLGEKAGKKPSRKEFEIEDHKSYSKDTFKIHDSVLSLYQPLRVKFKDEEGRQVENYLEGSFIDYLDRHPNEVEWFWQNGAEQMITNFGIGYNNDMSTFQPDFIIKFKDGRIGIFDTKPIGERTEDTKIKAEALATFLIEENLRRKEKGLSNVIGGIVISNNYDSIAKKYSNFKVFLGNEYKDFQEDSSHWVSFDSILNL